MLGRVGSATNESRAVYQALAFNLKPRERKIGALVDGTGALSHVDVSQYNPLFLA